MPKVLSKIILSFALILGLLCLAGIFLVVVLSTCEYRPKAEMELGQLGSKTNSDALTLDASGSISLLSWNIGYCGLNSEVDFFMDGGKMVRGASRRQLEKNANKISSYIKERNCDFIFLQEVDKKSTRSYKKNQINLLFGKNSGYCLWFANNYKCLFVPFPFPPIGKVDAGILNASKYGVSSAKRISLPVPFKWPIRVANLKRALLVTRVPIKNSDKELVLINLHLEAYSSGEAQVAQTQVLKKLIESEVAKGNFVIAGGDFNQTFSSIDLSAYPSLPDKWQPGRIEITEFEEGFTFLMDETVPSCRSLDKPYNEKYKSDFQFYIIDGFILSNNIRVKSFKVEDLYFQNSDHNPLLLEFELIN